MENRKTILHALLALLLLLSQQAGFAHAVSHFSETQRNSASQEKQLPAEQTCAECLAFAQIGSGLTDRFSLPAVDVAPDTVVPDNAAPLLSATGFLAFHSRAPPL